MKHHVSYALTPRKMQALNEKEEYLLRHIYDHSTARDMYIKLKQFIKEHGRYPSEYRDGKKLRATDPERRLAIYVHDCKSGGLSSTPAHRQLLEELPGWTW